MSVSHQTYKVFPEQFEELIYKACLENQPVSIGYINSTVNPIMESLVYIADFLNVITEYIINRKDLISLTPLSKEIVPLYEGLEITFNYLSNEIDKWRASIFVNNALEKPESENASLILLLLNIQLQDIKAVMMNRHDFSDGEYLAFRNRGSEIQKTVLHIIFTLGNEILTRYGSKTCFPMDSFDFDTSLLNIISLFNDYTVTGQNSLLVNLLLTLKYSVRKSEHTKVADILSGI